MEHEGDGDSNFNWHDWNNLRRIGSGTKRLGNKKTSRDNKIIKIGQNTEKSLDDLRRLAVTQTPVRNHHLTQV